MVQCKKPVWCKIAGYVICVGGHWNGIRKHDLLPSRGRFIRECCCCQTRARYCPKIADMSTRVSSSFVEADTRNVSIGLCPENYPQFHWRVICVRRIPWRCARLPDSEARGTVRNRKRRRSVNLGRVRRLV